MSHVAEAARLVLGDRNTDYGPPREDFERLASIWNGILGLKLTKPITATDVALMMVRLNGILGLKLTKPITATDVALMMVRLKINRHAHRPKDDHLVDAHGYLLCLEWIETGKKPEALA